MIKEFVDRFVNAKEKTLKEFAEHPEGYEDLVEKVIEIVRKEGSLELYPDPKRIVTINHGDYQGTLLFLIADDSYQPSTYWYTFVSYGSCSGCDTLEAIRPYDTDPPTKEQKSEYWTLMLHLTQGLTKISAY